MGPLKVKESFLETLIPQPRFRYANHNENQNNYQGGVGGVGKGLPLDFPPHIP